MAATPHAVGILVGGTSAALLSKAILSTRVAQEVFAKPGFCTTLVFAGYLLTFPIGMRHGAALRPDRRFLALSTVDVLSISLLQAGLVFVPASASLMLRMSSIAFTALFRRLLSGQRQSWRQVVALGLLALALALLALTLPALGCALTLLAQLLRGLVLVTEERLVAKLPPFSVLAGEGACGLGLMLAVVLPGLSVLPGGDHGALEWLPGTLGMLEGSALLPLLASLYVAAVTWEAASAIMVTALLSSVHRSFLQFGARIATVWVADLLLFQCSAGHYGEPWSPASWLQLCGFLVLLTSAWLYFGGGASSGNALVKAPEEPLLQKEAA